jgi:cupin
MSGELCYCLNLRGHDETGIHYNLRGRGTAFIGDGPPIDLAPHTLIIVPPHSPFRIEVAKPGRDLMPIDGRLQPANAEGLRRVVAGEGPPEVVLICGFFHALYGASEDLFGGLAAPVSSSARATASTRG